MFWYWKARIYFGRSESMCTTIEIKTNRDLHEIDTIQNFYKALTGEKMLLEGMSESPNSDLAFTPDRFYKLVAEDFRK